MSTLGRFSVATLLAAAVLAGSQPAGAATDSEPCLPWSFVASPRFQDGPARLVDVAAVSANDVWSVGWRDPGYGSSRTLVEHWDGTRWLEVPSPNVLDSDNFLSSVAVVSPTDVWAVGQYWPAGDTRPLIEHWDGVRWSIVAAPAVTDTYLAAVTTIGKDDVWAVGATRGRTFVVHWNGVGWNIVASPNIGSGANELNGVAATSSRDVWAVGSYSSGQFTLAEHWDGNEWTVVPTPNRAEFKNVLYDVAVRTATDAWAVGWDEHGQWPDDLTLVMHWNGASWTLVTSPDIELRDNRLYGVTVAGTEVLAVGEAEYMRSRIRNIAHHWDGAAWSAMRTLRFEDDFLVGVAAVSPADGWAVGGYFELTGPLYPLTLRLLGCPAVSAVDVVAHEGDRTAEVPATLAFPVRREVTVRYATADGTAYGGEDYTPATGRLSFTPGYVRATITVPLGSDTRVEPQETFSVRLSDPVNADLGHAEALVTIKDDDGPNRGSRAHTCRVPRVVGLKLPAARSRIRRAHCRAGRIRRARSRRVGRVLAQTPRAGTRRPAGARVNLVVGRR